MQNKLKTFFIFLLILLGLNVVYFYVYFSFLDLPFSWLHFSFIIFGNISYAILINIFKLRIWRLVSYLLISLFYVWALMNFAYFKVFKTFLDFGLGQFGQVNLNFLTFLKDFLYLVPVRLYFVSILVLIGIIVNSILYFKFIDRRNEKILYKTEKLNFLYFQKHRSHRFHKVIILIFLFAFVNGAAFGACAYLASSPKVSWWKIEQQITDLGLWGHFYNQVYAQVGANNQIKEDNLNNEEDLVEVVPESPLALMEKTRAIYSEMEQLAEFRTKKYSIPSRIEKPNIIVVQLESLPSWILENKPTPMPYLRQLIDNNITIGSFHPNSCQTINAEFSSLCSFWPNSEEPISYSHLENKYHCLPSILNEEYGYETYIFHSDYQEFWDRETLSPKWGFDHLYFVPHYNVKQDDISVFTDAVDVLSKETKPFFAYLISFSTHSPHNDSMYEYNKWVNNIEAEPFSGDLNEDFKNIELIEEEVRDYLGFTKITDDALKKLFEKLKSLSLLDNTIVVIYNDHKYYNFRGEGLADWQKTYESPFVMVLPSGARGQIQSIASHVDIAPTLLNLIEQDDYKPRSNFIGTSLFQKDFPNQALNKCLGEIYYINDEVLLRGNAKTMQYQVFEEFEKVPEIKKQKWLSLISSLVIQSDETIYSDGLVD